MNITVKGALKKAGVDMVKERELEGLKIFKQLPESHRLKLISLNKQYFEHLEGFHFETTHNIEMFFDGYLDALVDAEIIDKEQYRSLVHFCTYQWGLQEFIERGEAL